MVFRECHFRKSPRWQQTLIAQVLCPPTLPDAGGSSYRHLLSTNPGSERQRFVSNHNPRATARESNERCRGPRPIAMGAYLIAGTAMNGAVWQRHYATSDKALLSRLPLTFQNSQDRNDRIPVPCYRLHAVQLVDLAKITDCLHVTTVHSKHELSFRRHHLHQPFPA